MGNRLDLQALLVSLLGSSNVYYDPPENIKMGYPAIVYFLDKVDKVKADSIMYNRKNRYSITLIDKNPESIYFDSILKLRYCSHNRNYVSNGLHHFVFNLYY